MAPHARDKEKLARMEQAVRVLINGLGEDIEREGLRDTPKRVAKALLDCTQGYHQDTSSTLGTALFHEPIVHEGDEGVVVVRDIDFASTSEETLLPFHGRCHVAYRPKDGVVLGLSKLARLTKQYAKRLQTQERLALEIALALQQSLECHGVAVVLSARHLCNAAPPGERTNVCVSGVFAGTDSTHLEELLTLLGHEDLPASAVQSLDAGLAASLKRLRPDGPGVAASSAPADGGVAAPGTPDPSEKDTDGDSDDLMSSEAPFSAADEMETAMQQLLAELGENPHRPGLVGSARRYVMSLLASTSGYHHQHQQHPQLHRQQRTGEGQRSSAGGAAVEAPAGCGAAGPGKSGGPSNGTGGDGARCAPAGRGASCAAVLRGAVGHDEVAVRTTANGVTNCTFGSSHVVAACDGVGTSCSDGASGNAGAACVPPNGCASLGTGRGCLQGALSMRLPFTSQCEHHMLPFYGSILVSYFPSSAGPLPRSALEGVVAAFTQRLQVQERITHQVADAVLALLSLQSAGSTDPRVSAPALGCCSGGADAASNGPSVAQGGEGTGSVSGSGSGGDVMVVCDAAHMCMVARGVENHSGSTTTFAVRGAFVASPELRRAVLRLFREH